jgi:indole-3-glycerol phosphate synthase
MNQLEPILTATVEEVRRRRQAIPLAALERAGAERLEAGDLRPFAAALHASGLSVIAEHKRRSPSAGVIREGLSLEQVVGSYERAGAAALSILTNGPSFGGSLDDLRAARAATRLPLLRKDFIVEPYQLHESLAAGADAVLLIVAALPAPALAELHQLARQLGLETLVEVHDRDEIEVAVDAGAEIVGINNRDLTTLTVDARRTFELLPRIPPGTTTVAESGFSRPAQLAPLTAAGVDAVLIGEALMRAENIEAACRELTGSL